MRAMIVAVVMLGAACGPDFDGVFQGQLQATQACSDGTAGAATIGVAWTLVEAGSNLSIRTGGGCDPLSAVVRGDTAELQPKTCPPFTDASGITDVLMFRFGTLRLLEPNIQISVTAQDNLTPSPPAPAACNATLSGQLRRQAR